MEIAFETRCADGEGAWGTHMHLATFLEGNVEIRDAGAPVAPSPLAITFDYPFKEAHEIVLSADEGGAFTRGGLIAAIARQYELMYKEEADTTTLPVETMAARAKREGKQCPLLNRAQTDGRWEIWGHGLGDLYLEGMVLDGHALKLIMGS